MPINERSAAYDYGHVCRRMLETMIERAATEGLTPDEVQVAIRLDQDIKQMFDAYADEQETDGARPSVLK